MSKEEKKEFISTQCTICGGKMDVDLSAETVECPFCGNAFPTENYATESDTVKIEKIKATVEIEKLQHEKEKIEHNESKEKLQTFKKGKLSKFLIICAILSALCCWISFNDGKILSGIIALVQFVLYTGSWLMGMQIVKEPKKGLRVLATILALVLIVPYFSMYSSSNSNRTEKFLWSEVVLSSKMPQPAKLKGHIYTNTNEAFHVSDIKATKEDFETYVSDCKTLGFTVDEEKDDYSFEAYNQDGDHIRVSFYNSDKELSIDFDVAMKMEQIIWPVNVLVKQLPVPKSLYGKIDYEHSGSFSVHLANITKVDYSEYVNQCINAGFNIDYTKNEKNFYADNSKGDHISVSYEGNNIMHLRIEQADDNTKEDEADTSNNDTAQSEPTKEAPETLAPVKTGISDDFKTAMDSYEKFFDEYVAFMKKYADSDGTDLKLLADYASYMQQYADTMAKFEAIEEDDLSPQELAYYAQVQGRITKKLLEVAQ